MHSKMRWKHDGEGWACVVGRRHPERFALARCQCDSVGGPAGLMSVSGVSVSIVIDFLVFDGPYEALTPT